MSTCWKVSRAASVQSWLASGAAINMGGEPPSPGASGVPALPPLSVTAAPPVSPCVSRPTWVSLLMGVLGSTPMVAITWSGASAESERLVTSPTRMPLNNTAEPISRPDTEPWKRI